MPGEKYSYNLNKTIGQLGGRFCDSSLCYRLMQFQQSVATNLQLKIGYTYSLHTWRVKENPPTLVNNVMKCNMTIEFISNNSKS